jgi:hypothetical protein
MYAPSLTACLNNIPTPKLTGYDAGLLPDFPFDEIKMLSASTAYAHHTKVQGGGAGC